MHIISWKLISYMVLRLTLKYGNNSFVFQYHTFYDGKKSQVIIEGITKNDPLILVFIMIWWKIWEW